MAFIRTVPEEQATGQLGEMYDADRSTYGYVPNYTKVLSIRPGIMGAYRDLARAIRSGMDLRRYELITVAVAARLRCSYKITARDIDRLRGVGLSDEEIVDVAAAAAQRNFASRLYDALGAEPDEAYRQLEPSLVDALDVGGRWTGGGGGGG